MIATYVITLLAAYLLVRYFWTEKKPTHDAMAMTLFMMVVLTVVAKYRRSEQNQKIWEVCEVTQDVFVRITDDEDAANTASDFPAYCNDVIYGSAE